MVAKQPEKVAPGDPLQISYRTWNDLLDLVALKPTERLPGPRLKYQTGVVTVQNVSASNRSTFDVMAVDGPFIDPTVRLEDFQSRLALKCNTPDATSTALHNSVVVLKEPIRANEFGRAFIDGICPVQVEIYTTTPRFADFIPNTTNRLREGGGGTVRILTRPSTVGIQWCYVQLGASSGEWCGKPVSDIGPGAVGLVTDQEWDGNDFVPRVPASTTEVLNPHGIELKAACRVRVECFFDTDRPVATPWEWELAPGGSQTTGP